MQLLLDFGGRAEIPREMKWVGLLVLSLLVFGGGNAFLDEDRFLGPKSFKDLPKLEDQNQEYVIVTTKDQQELFNVRSFSYVHYKADYK